MRSANAPMINAGVIAAKVPDRRLLGAHRRAEPGGRLHRPAIHRSRRLAVDRLLRVLHPGRQVGA